MKKICPHCKKMFEAHHGRQKYCSDSHRVSAYYKRKGFKVVLIAPDDFKNKNTELGMVNNQTVQEKEPEYKNSFLKQTGAAALGNLASQTLINFFKSDDDKPVTRKEMKILFDLLYKSIQAVRTNQVNIYKNIMRELLAIKRNL